MNGSCLMMSLVLVAGTTAAHAAAPHAPPTCTVLPDDVTIDINGGFSWNGWTSRGFSNQAGVYAAGSTTAVYEIYTTVFTFKKCKHRVDERAIQINSDQIPRDFERGKLAGGCDGFTDYNQGDSSLQNGSGRPVTNGGAFDDGNIILGIGVRVVDNAQFEAFDTTTASADARRENRWGGWRFFKFGLNNDGQTSYEPASTVGGTDGRINSNSHANPGDFVMSASLGKFRFTTQEVTIRTTGAITPGVHASAASGLLYIPGGFHGPHGGAVSYDFPMRSFGADVDGQVHAYQTFLDITAVQKLYGPDSVSEDSILDIGGRDKGMSTAGVGPINLDNLVFCIYGYRDNQSVISIVPKPQVRTVTAPVIDPGYD
ncbi:MAG: hypothetical protein RL689_217 [Planctomycetota bacterium]